MLEWKDEIKGRLAGLKLEPAREAAIIEELSQHLDDCYADLLASGATSPEAERRTLAELSERELLARELRRVEQQVVPEPIVLGTNRRANMIAELWQDLRFGVRMLLKYPGVAFVAVLVTALGISANTTIFSVAHSMILRPFNFVNQERLIAVWERNSEAGSGRGPVAPGNFTDWREQHGACERLVAIEQYYFDLADGDQPERFNGHRVTAGFFDALGVKAAYGRTFLPEESEPGREQVVVLRYGFWRQRFAGDPSIVGKTLTLNGKSFTVVGVAPPDFNYPYHGGQMLTPLVFDPQTRNDRGRQSLGVMGLLKPGVSIPQAQADLEEIARRAERQFPETNSGRSVYVLSLREDAVRGTAVAMPTLIGAAIFVLLIACANVANLLLARAAGRRQEIAVRLALGASRWRLIRQLLTESVLLGRVESLPDVAEVGAINIVPLSGTGVNTVPFQIIGQPAFPKGRKVTVHHRVATPGYFKAIGTALRKGRLFTEQDGAQATPVVLINETVARRFFPDGEPVGERLKFGDGEKGTVEIIGVVADVKNDDLEERADPAVYVPFAQQPWRTMNLIVHTRRDPTLLAGALRGQVSALDRSVPVSQVKTLGRMIDERISPKRMLTWVIGVFAAVALLLAAVGIYAVISYVVAQRTHEIGIRLALGADSRDILRLVVTQGLKLTLIGLVIGLAVAFALTRAMSFFLFGVTATDPLTFIGVSLLLASVALIACWIPARRATKVDPMIALRCE